VILLMGQTRQNGRYQVDGPRWIVLWKLERDALVYPRTNSDSAPCCREQISRPRALCEWSWRVYERFQTHR
jgi:hypothetical protein